MAEVTPLARLLADPDSYIGKRVRVEGEVLDVCPKKGCWLEVGADEARLRLKVEDDVIVFPRDSKGQIAAAEGILEANVLSRDQYVGWLAHLAEERGEKFDPDKADIGEGPYRLLQLQVTGARLEPR